MDEIPCISAIPSFVCFVCFVGNYLTILCACFSRIPLQV